MFIGTSMLPKVAVDFVSSVLVPKAPTPALKFALGFALPYVGDAAQAQIAQMTPVLKALGVINENGKVDLDKAKDAAYKGLQNAGGQLTLYGYTADKSDIDALFSFAQKYAVNE